MIWYENICFYKVLGQDEIWKYRNFCLPVKNTLLQQELGHYLVLKSTWRIRFDITMKKIKDICFCKLLGQDLRGMGTKQTADQILIQQNPSLLITIGHFFSSLVFVREEILRLFDYAVCAAASVLCYIAADSLCISFSSSKMMIFQFWFQDKDISLQNPKVVSKMESQLPWSLRMEDIPRSLMWSKTKSFFSTVEKNENEVVWEKRPFW